MLALSFALAWATYACIERPLRFGTRQGLTSVVLLVAVLLIGFVGFNTFKRDGLAFRSINKLNPIPLTATLRSAMLFASPECGISTADRPYFFMCAQDKTKPVRYVVWGDSKGEALFWGLLQKQDAQYGWRVIGDAGCAPMSGAHRTTPAMDARDPEKCLKGNQVALRSILDNPDIQVVVLGTAFRVLTQFSYADDAGRLSSEQAVWHGLSTAIDTLEQAGKKVIFVVDNPTLPDPSLCRPNRQTQSTLLNRILARPLNAKCTINHAQHLQETRSYRDGVTALQARHPQLLVYTPDHLLCELDKGICSVLKNEHFLYSYTDHLSDYGAGLLADEIVKLVEPTGPASGSP